MRVRPSLCRPGGLRPGSPSRDALLAAAVLAAVSAPVAAQQQFAELGKRHLPFDDDATSAVAYGDVDGDADLDLVVGNDEEQHRLYLNLLRQLDAPHLLRVGYDYRLDVYARYGPPRLADVALPFLSLGTASIPLPAFVVPRATGVGAVTVTVPNAPALAGIPLYGQALLIQYPAQDRLTNVTADRIRDL